MTLFFEFLVKIFGKKNQILFRTWGMNLAIIACLFELVDGLQKNMFFTFFSEHFGEKKYIRLAYCRRRFFLLKNNVSWGKRQFSSARGLPQAPFLTKNKN